MLLFALSLLACSSDRPQLKRGTPAPSFSAETIKGDRIQVPKAVEGQVVAIRFWADWCPFCSKEMREVEQVYKELSDKGLTVLAVNVGQDRWVAQRFIERLGISYTAVLDPNSEIARRYGVIGLPTTFFVDRQGRIHSKILGESDAAIFRQAVEPLL
jgi:peroxiredoxin